jgi:hypothetical protein
MVDVLGLSGAPSVVPADRAEGAGGSMWPNACDHESSHTLRALRSRRDHPQLEWC